MKFTEIHAAIHKDFGAEVALAAVQILTISMITKTKNSDLVGKTKWSDRVLKKAEKVLWETPKEDFELAKACWSVIHSWDARQQLHGLGGCVVKTFAELVADVNHAAESWVIQPTKKS